ncbi:MAG: hypothetical protein WC091_23685 [Sulfuricellaceae bacterium]
MSNPEFKRNLWLSFSPQRLIGMPALLALTFTATAFTNFRNSNVADNLYGASIALFIFIVWIWGVRNANATIVDELRDQTWDQQRMSALTPWTMTWGKLFGATAYNWYGGFMCLAVVALSGVAADKPNVLPALITLSAVGVLLHAALIALNLYTHQFEARIVQRGGVGWMGIVWGVMFIPALISLLISGNISKHVVWWRMEVDGALFVMDSTVLFAVCATFAAWRVVSNALQVRTLPWAWPLFAGILALYLAGFMRFEHLAQRLLMSGLFVSVGMTYVALISEPNTLLRWRKLRLLQSRQDWRGWLEYLPLWPTTLLMSFLFALLIVLTGSEEFVGYDNMNFSQPPQALTIALMLLRDTCILLFFSFGQNNKRAVSATMLSLIVLNLLLPLLTGIADLKTVRFFLLPFEAGHAPWSGALIMIFHAAIAIGLVNRRLRSAQQG